MVGAGPAGSVAALTLARAGVRVRLIDRERFPRHKLCGDTLNPGALAVLDALDRDRPAAARLGDAVRARALSIAGMTVSGPGGVQVTADYPRALRGASLTRDVLDARLIDAAIAAGVDFEDGVAAREAVTDDGRVVGVRVGTGQASARIDARLVVLADGRGSRIASALGLTTFVRKPRRWAFGSYFTGVAGTTAHGEMHVRPGADVGGYIGVAPLPGDLTNVCVVMSLERARTVDRGRVIEDAVAAEPLLRDRFTSARRVSPVTVLGPLGLDASAAGQHGLLLAGDVAGFIDPMTGDGLRFALRGGVLAADAALHELTSGQPAFRSLATMRAREFRVKLGLNRTLRAAAGSPLAVGLIEAVSARWAAPMHHLIGIAGDVSCVPRREHGMSSAPADANLERA